MTPAYILLDVPRLVRYRRIAAMVGGFALVLIASALAGVVALWLAGFVR